MNGAIHARLGEEDQPAVDKVVAFFRESGLPASWHVGPTSTPDNLGAMIENAGGQFQFSMPTMVADLTVMGLPTSDVPGTRVEEVCNEEQYDDWARLGGDVFNVPENALGFFRASLCPTPLGPGRRLRKFVAYCDGRPAATSAVFLDDGVAGIYSVGTYPEFRNRGLGAAITIAALQAGRTAGCHTAILQSSKAGFRLYERLGFTECGLHARYDIGA
jgi:ribosomal protein S18 acetylase RimI-like enzyme